MDMPYEHPLIINRHMKRYQTELAFNHKSTIVNQYQPSINHNLMTND